MVGSVDSKSRLILYLFAFESHMSATRTSSGQVALDNYELGGERMSSTFGLEAGCETNSNVLRLNPDSCLMTDYVLTEYWFLCAMC